MARRPSNRARADAQVSEAKQSLSRAKRAYLAVSGESIQQDTGTGGSLKDQRDAIRRAMALGTRRGEAMNKLTAAETLLRDAIARRRGFDSAAAYFAALPEPLATGKTDADGRFKLTVPEKDEIVVLATSSRMTFDRVERYFWIVRLAPQETHLTLSNDNLTTSGSADSLVLTKE